jgi:hypothetical protein
MRGRLDLYLLGLPEAILEFQASAGDKTLRET